MDQIIKEIEKLVAGVLSSFNAELSGVRTSRPSPQLVEDIKIEYFEQLVPIKQLGSISVVPPREMMVNLWDPSGIQTVAKALEDAKRGFTVSVRGNAIAITLPPLSQERRDEFIRVAKNLAEAAKIKLRGLRDDANRKLASAKLAKSITEDMEFKGKKKVQEAIDKGNREIEASVDKKIKEINE